MSESTEAAITNQELIDLSAPRVIAFNGAERTYKLTCRPVTREDWLAYYEALEVTSKREGKDLVDLLDLDTPRRVLAERVLIHAEGYQLVGGEDLMVMPDWRRRIPLAHRQKVGSLLSSVSIEREGPQLISAEGEVVHLRAVWSSDGIGSMKVFKGLKHVLQTPNEEQYRRYAREANRTCILGGSRAGTTLYPGVQPLLATLYDELVISVDGYIAEEEPLTDRDAIVRSMDTHHKVIVANEIFAPPLLEIAG